MRSRGDLKVAIPPFVQDGDYVVPESNILGKQTEEGMVLGNEKKVNKMALSMARHAQNHGGTPLPKLKQQQPVVASKIKGKPTNQQKKKKQIETYEEPVMGKEESNEQSTKTVTFQNKFGKIKLSCFDVLEEEQAICLVFASEDEVRFTPEQGEELDLITPGGSRTRVFFPGVIFTYSDQQKRLMILFRANEA